jgi:hypothetical protein
MKLAIDLDNLTFVNPLNPSVAAREVSMRRDDVLPLEVIFFKGGTRFELADGTTVSGQLNEKDTYGGAGLSSDSSADKTGTGVDSVYTLDFDLSGAAVDSAFTAESDPAYLNALLEVKLDDGTHTQRTAPLTVRLQNAVDQA